MQALATGGAPLLQPATLRYAMGDQLPAGRPIGFPGYALTGRGHSFAESVFCETPTSDPATEAGAVQWRSAAAARWVVAPKDFVALVLMTQRYEGSSLP